MGGPKLQDSQRQTMANANMTIKTQYFSNMSSIDKNTFYAGSINDTEEGRQENFTREDRTLLLTESSISTSMYKGSIISPKNSES